MKKSFCQTCGIAFEYEQERPKFSPNCGHSLGGSTALQSPPRRPVYQQNQNWEDEVEQNDFSIDLDSVRVNLASAAPRIFKGEEVFGTGSTGFDARPKILQADYKKFEKKMREVKPEPIEI